MQKHFKLNQQNVVLYKKSERNIPSKVPVMKGAKKPQHTLIDFDIISYLFSFNSTLQNYNNIATVH